MALAFTSQVWPITLTSLPALTVTAPFGGLLGPVSSRESPQTGAGGAVTGGGPGAAAERGVGWALSGCALWSLTTTTSTTTSANANRTVHAFLAGVMRGTTGLRPHEPKRLSHVAIFDNDKLKLRTSLCRSPLPLSKNCSAYVTFGRGMKAVFLR